MPRYTSYEAATLLRAARHARMPGVLRATVCERFAISPGNLRRAMKEHALASILTPRDFVMHALTEGGTNESGVVPNLTTLASYVDFNNKDGCQSADVERMLALLVDEGMLAVDEKGAHGDFYVPSLERWPVRSGRSSPTDRF